MRISDFLGYKNKAVLKVLKVENPYADYFIIKLKAEDLKWQPGEHGIFRIPRASIEGKKWRAFSVASIPEEKIVMIGTRTGKEVSSFKAALTQLKEDDEIKINGPFGWFKLKEDNDPIVLIATGVGITPIRAIAKSLENDYNRDVIIIYNSKDYHLFGDDLENIAQMNDKITLHKISNRQEGSDLIDNASNTYGSSAYYYISGSMKTIKAIKKQLKNNGVKGKRIINDPFLGY